MKVDADGLWIERGGLTLPVRRLGDGYRAVAHLVLSLVQHLHAHHGALTWTRHADGHLACEQAAVVLIDEIDAHLHVSWQREIGFWLTRRFPNIQFLVTTHSPFVCQAASPRGLIRLPAPGEDRRIEHVSDDVFRSVVHGTVDDAVLTELFGLDHARSDRTEARLDEMAELEGRVLEGLATEQELGRYRSLRDELGDPLRAAVKRAADGAG